MARMPGLTKVGYEERDEMTTRHTDAPLPQKGLEGVPVCKECMAIYLNKRWYSIEEGSPRLGADTVRYEVLRPACQRMRDNDPAGVATFTGDYLAEHESEILDARVPVEP